VKAAFSRHVLLRLYTDQVPNGVQQTPDARGAVELRNETFKTAALPLYALVRPVDDRFEIIWKDDQGLIHDVERFLSDINRS
jgi:hypothetical protein